jgi:hypothetical protein
MPKRPDTPCAGCGKLLWSGPNSLPAGRRRCRDCLKTAPEPVSAPQTPPVAPDTPSERFGPRGARLWRDMDGDKQTPADRALLEEACRTADRLDKLDDFLTGRGDVWLRFHARNEDGTVVRVVVDRALSEVRQQQDVFRGLIADLGRKQAAQSPAEEPKESILDELDRRRKERQQAAAGS